MTEIRRRYERIQIDLAARLFLPEAPCAKDLRFEAFCRTGNLSLGGVFVIADFLLKPGVELYVELELESGPLPILARISHTVSHGDDEFLTGMGFEFLDVDAYGRETLLRSFTPDRYHRFYQAMLKEFPHLESEIDIPEASLVLNLWEEWKVLQEGGPAGTASGAPEALPRRRR